MFDRKGVREAAWIALTVLSALAATTAFVATLYGGLTIIHLVALILVMGLACPRPLVSMFGEASTKSIHSKVAAKVICAILLPR